MRGSATNRVSVDRKLDNAKLKKLVRRKTSAWAKIYAAQPDGPELVRSLLLGAEAMVREYLGLMPAEMREKFSTGTILTAYYEGRACMASVDLYAADIFTD